MSGAIEVAWDVPRPEGERLADAEVERAAAAALAHGGLAGRGLAVTFVDEGALTRMHAVHLDDPTPTDVITFDLGDEGVGPIGELYVSVDRAREQAAGRAVPLVRELLLYVVHGALHLCGFDDHEPEERRRMRVAEAEVMRALGFDPDPSPHDL